MGERFLGEGKEINSILHCLSIQNLRRVLPRQQCLDQLTAYEQIDTATEQGYP